MQVTVETTGEIGRRLTVQVPSHEIKTATRNKMKEISKKTRIPGFRTNAVIPEQLMEKRFGSQARQEAVGKVIETTLPKALEQEQLKPAGRPMVERITNDEHSDFKYVVSFEIFPEVALIDFSQLTAEKNEVTITEEDIEKTIENLKLQCAEWVTVKRPAQLGDRVLIDYTSTMNGKPYKDNQGQDVAVELGSKLFLDGFEEALIGKIAGDELSLDLVFPKNWRMEKLADKPVHFSVKVKGVSEKKPSELNLPFAKKIGAESAEIEVIRNKVRENLEKQLSGIIENRLREHVTNTLLKMNSFPIPKALIDREASLLHEEMHQRRGDKGQMTCHHPELMVHAEKRVALGLILNEVIKAEKLLPDEAKVKDRVASLSKMFGNADFIESMYYESEELLAGVRHSVLLDQALDFVVSKAKIVMKPSTLDEIFNRKT